MRISHETAYSARAACYTHLLCRVCRASFVSLPTMQTIRKDWSRPVAEVVPIATRLRATSSSLAVAPDVPQASVSSGRQQSIADSRRSPCPLRQGRTTGGPRVLPKLAVLQAKDRPCRARPANPVPGRGPKQPPSRWPRSALGPHGIGNRWSPAGTSGHGRQIGIAGHRQSTATTSDGEAALDRVRTPHPTATVSPLGPDGRQLPIISGQHRQADTQLSERARRSRRSNERSSGSLKTTAKA
jgi:hypothetical protein